MQLRAFRKRMDIGIVILPGKGRVKNNEILLGDEFAAYAPHLLEELSYPLPAPRAEEDEGPAPVLTEQLPAVEDSPTELTFIGTALLEAEPEKPAVSDKVAAIFEEETKRSESKSKKKK